MSPSRQPASKKVKIPANLYTVILAVAFAVVTAAAVFVMVQCYRQYGSLSPIP